MTPLLLHLLRGDLHFKHIKEKQLRNNMGGEINTADQINGTRVAKLYYLFYLIMFPSRRASTSLIGVHVMARFNLHAGPSLLFPSSVW